MSKNVKRLQEGFTIIEVLIVLAIAGVILLLVFRAVPALNRNSHNTAAKSDVSALLGGVSEYMNNNSGALPPAQTAGPAGQTKFTIGTSPAATADVNLGYYTADQVTIVDTVPASAPTSGVIIVKKATCNGNTATATGASPRGYAAWFAIEGGSAQCQSS